MKKKSFIFLACACLLACSNGKSQDSDSMMAEVFKICSKADIINVEHKVESTEIEFLCGKTPYSLVFDKQGNKLYKESAFHPTSDFLTKTNKKIQKTHAGWIIDEYSLIETNDTSFVKIELIKDGVEENMFFTIDGKFYKFKNYSTTEEWSEKTLKKNKYLQSTAYDLLNPTNVYEMPEVLKEISGLCVVGDSVLFCIQDELGMVFQFDLRDQSVSNVLRFTDIGDFEDIQTVGDDLFVLRSDGALFSMNYKNFKGKAEQIMLPIPCMNMEGLFYDKNTNKLLIACKEPSVDKIATSKKEHKQDIAMKSDMERAVYSFDKQNNSIEKILSIKIEDIRAFVKKNYNQHVETFNPSAIAIHPITNDIYILSANQRLLSVYNENSLKDVFLLSPEEYYKPEGIDFLQNGDMIIGSEGMKKGALQGKIYVIKKR